MSGGESGLYQIEILHDRRRLDSDVAWLQARISEMGEEVASSESAVADALDSVIVTSEELQDAISQISEDREAFTKAQEAHGKSSAALSSARASASIARARLAALENRLQSLQSIPDDPVVEAWCADYTEDLEGDVGTVDLPGEGHKRTIIWPGFNGAALYDIERDGQLRHRESCTPEQAFLNAALLPGWQRWQYPYRVGVITELSGDVCDVILDHENSSAQNLPVQDQEQITGVPIEYMDCNGAAFEEGDRVLVDISAPKVFGFEGNPKACSFDLWFLRTNPYDTWFSSFGTVIKAPAMEYKGGLAFGGGWSINTLSIHKERVVQAYYDGDGSTAGEFRVNGIEFATASGFSMLSVCCTRDRIITMETNVNHEQNAPIVRVRDSESFFVFSEFHATFSGTQWMTTENGHCASETEILIPVSPEGGDYYLCWYSFGGTLLRSEYLGFDPFPFAVASDGIRFAVCLHSWSDDNGRVAIYGPNGLETTIVIPGSGGDSKNRPHGVAMNRNHVCVSQPGLNRVLVYKRADDGTYDMAGEYQTPGEYPVAISVDESLRAPADFD